MLFRIILDREKNQKSKSQESGFWGFGVGLPGINGSCWARRSMVGRPLRRPSTGSGWQSLLFKPIYYIYLKQLPWIIHAD